MRNSVLCYLEDTVKKFPNKVALTDESSNLSFSDWKHMGLCLAEEIQKRNIGRYSPILVYLPKSCMTLVSFVAVLYSGNYYTPTDVRFPFEKANSIIQCLNPQLIITNHKCSEKLIAGGVSEDKMVYIEDVDFSRQEVQSEQFLEKIIDTDLAYVFFTSGSTGVPKGVAITQRSIIDYIDWAVEKFSIDENTIIGNQAPFYFDNSILDIYLCMKCGAHLHIVPEMYYSFPAKLLNYISDNKINFIFWVPSALIGVSNSGLLEKVDCSCIKKVLFCGEVMPNRHLNYWRNHIDAEIYANLYGPTEITDVCACYIVDREFKDEEPLPIGKACKNTQILILDDDNNIITEKDVQGELCVRGTCISVGYYGNEEKTSEVFVQNPIQNYYYERIYRTGDIAHYNEYDEIMFDGRKDFQIKHMGYRIELGEIETAILSIDSIENACCIYDEAKTEIVAFCQTKGQLTETDIRKQLMNLLPKYMIPTKYHFLVELPFNDNGKINRKELKRIYIDDNDTK